MRSPFDVDLRPRAARTRWHQALQALAAMLLAALAAGLAYRELGLRDLARQLTEAQARAPAAPSSAPVPGPPDAALLAITRLLDDTAPDARLLELERCVPANGLVLQVDIDALEARTTAVVELPLADPLPAMRECLQAGEPAAVWHTRVLEAYTAPNGVALIRVQLEHRGAEAVDAGPSLRR
jgi:hypothetical protein